MEARVKYVARSPLLEKEKSFFVDFPVDHIQGARSSNHEPDWQNVEVIPAEDPTGFELDKHGFCFLNAKTQLDIERVYSNKEETQDDYWYQIEAILHEAFPQYSRIECFDLTVRKRDSDFPRVVRNYQKYEQPSAVPHCDYSRHGGLMALGYSFPGQEDYWKDKDFDLLNVWRPLVGPTDDWPFALVDYRTINPDVDIVINDTIRREVVGEDCLLHYSKEHKWYHLKDQDVDDLIIFRNTDAQGKRARAFHCGVQNANSTGPPRESVEVRAVAIY
ncbi:methyltransferase [Apiospora marii]|uniref:Methyltransferase n=1 Tax=Apiospora marii TaxID=335849 RepID=A0ABR1RJ33_9PEZI